MFCSEVASKLGIQMNFCLALRRRFTMVLRGHLKIFTLNVIVTLKGGGGGLWQMSMTLIFEISIARAQKDINSMQVQ